MNYLGIDLGGTNVAAGVVSENGQIIARGGCPTPRGEEAVCDAIAEASRQALEGAHCDVEDLASIGIGSPGVIDPERGVVVYWSNLDFKDVPLAALVQQRLGRAVLMENDANTAALGEYAAGAGRGASSMVAITLGTGIGGGAVLGGKLYTGFNYAGLEVGHMVVDASAGAVCTCGRRGCFEVLASATALVRQTRHAMEEHPESLLWKLAPSLDKVEGKIVFQALAQGDATAQNLVDKYVQYLGCGVTNLVNIFQPEVLCIGGGISLAGDTLLSPLRALVNQEEYTRNSPRRTRLALAQLGNDAGIIGAALLSKFR